MRQHLLYCGITGATLFIGAWVEVDGKPAKDFHRVVNFQREEIPATPPVKTAGVNAPTI